MLDVGNETMDTVVHSLLGSLFQNNFTIFTLKNKSPQFQDFHNVQSACDAIPAGKEKTGLYS